MEIKITQVTGSYHIMRIGDKKYVMENKTFTPKSYFWFRKKENVTVDIVEELPSDTMFHVKKSSLGQSSIVIITQVILKPIYDLMGNLLREDSENYVLLKTMMFLLSLLVGYVIYRIVFAKEDATIGKKLLQGNRKRLRVVFKTSRKRKCSSLSFGAAILTILSFIVYLCITNGDEGLILILSGLMAFATYTFSFRLLPIGVFHQFNDLMI